MQAFSLPKATLAGLALLALGSCGEDMTTGGSFQAQYAVARNALEAGNYEKAKRGYAKLMQQAGPLQPRLQLEYAHSELRSGNFAEAARLSGDLARQSKGAERGAALSVLGTAQHELGIDLLQKGETESGRQLLKAALSSLSEVVKDHPNLDPLGSMAGRKASIESRLKTL